MGKIKQLIISALCLIAFAGQATADNTTFMPASILILKAPFSGESFIYAREGERGYKLLASDGKILEYSPDTSPIEDGLKRTKEVAQRAIGAKLSPGREELLYAGPNLFLVRYPVTDSKGNECGKVTVDTRTLQIVDALILKSNPRMRPGAPENMASKSRIIDNIPSLPYIITEGSTTAAAILKYWGENGADALTGKKSDRDLVISLTTASCGCNLDKLFETYARRAGYTVKTTHITLPSDKDAASYTTYMQSIDKGIPGVIVYSSNGLKRIMAGVGYQTDDTGCYVIVKDQGVRDGKETPSGYICLRWDIPYEKMEFTAIEKPKRSEKTEL